MVLIWKDPVFKSKGTQDEGAGYNSILHRCDQWKTNKQMKSIPRACRPPIDQHLITS